MTTRFLAWYLSGLLILISMLLSVTTFADGSQLVGIIAQGVCGALAVVFAGLGNFCGQMSPEHWVNRSRILQEVLLMLAACITLCPFGGIAVAIALLVRKIF